MVPDCLLGKTKMFASVCSNHALVFLSLWGHILWQVEKVRHEVKVLRKTSYKESTRTAAWRASQPPEHPMYSKVEEFTPWVRLKTFLKETTPCSWLL